MADELVSVRIFFKEPVREESYQMTAQERDRLTDAFCSANNQISHKYGKYPVRYGNDERVLALRFSDVLFIG